MNPLEFTGERYVPEHDSPEISYAHWHRYLYAQQFVKNKRVLDIACGEGYGSHLLAQTAKEVIGIDNDVRTVHHATEKYNKENLSFIVGSVCDIPVRDTSIFDAIVSFDTIEHVNEELQYKFLYEIKRLLKEDGIFLISTPNRQFCGDIPMFKNDFHVKELYIREFKELLNRHFRHVILLGQNLYAGSYIWNPEIAAGDFLRSYIEFSKGDFHPVNTGKYVLYMMAICSDHNTPYLRPSLLIDVSQRVFRLRLQDIIKFDDKDKNMSLLQSALQKKEQQLKAVSERFATAEGQLSAIHGSRGWKVLMGYYRVRDILLHTGNRAISFAIQILRKLRKDGRIFPHR